MRRGAAQEPSAQPMGGLAPYARIEMYIILCPEARKHLTGAAWGTMHFFFAGVDETWRVGGRVSKRCLLKRTASQEASDWRTRQNWKKLGT